MIWREGYLAGALQADLYPDAAAGLRRWHAEVHRLAVYSSGSVAAQQLLFAHTDAGDLTTLCDAFFDTESGPKLEAASYRTIATRHSVPAPGTVFLSAVLAELHEAVRSAKRAEWKECSRTSRPPA